MSGTYGPTVAEERRPTGARWKVQNTRFIFAKSMNFAGDPAKDKWGNPNPSRKGNIVIPEDMAMDMMAEGLPVKQEKEWEDDPQHERRYYIPIVVRYRDDNSRNPEVYLVDGDTKERRELGPNNIGLIDDSYVSSVSVAFNPWLSPRNNKYTYYVQKMDVVVYKEDDPFDSDGNRKPLPQQPLHEIISDDDDLPF